MQLYFGVVEDRADPLKNGRCKVRVVGLHTHDKTLLPTKDLPWAIQISNNSASMNGIGESLTGLVEGSTVAVMFADEDLQIPIILGSIPGIPQVLSKLIDASTDDVEINLDDSVDDTVDAPVSEAPTKVDPSNVVPKEGAPGFGPLVQAMDEAGITSKYARASILGICQVESNFKTNAENLNYSAQGLLATFPSTFKGDLNLAKSVERKPQNIAELIYGPVRGKGRELGNTIIGDGYLYRGRGYVQLTGKANYAKYSSAAGVDLVNNPDALLDETISSKVTVAYFLDRVKTNQNDPNYYASAVKAVGNNRKDIAEKKYNAYLYYLGDSGTLDQTDKTTDVSKSQNQHSSMINGIPKDRVDFKDYGFSDPNYKYPLKSHLKEPDTNRLARGRFTGTVTERKDKSKKINVPVADGSIWNQPDVPYNAQYPYNHVYETESGHVQEFDDTPGNERIHTYHRKGTFEEIDSNGTKVTRIVGDNYEIIDRNGFLFLAGDYNVTATGNMNLLSESNANIKIYGNANINVHGSASTNVAGDYNLNVGGVIRMKASRINVETSNWNLKADKLTETADGDASYYWNGDIHRFVGADTYNRHDIGTDYSCPSDPPRDSDLDCGDVDEASSSGLGSTVGRLTPANPKFTRLVTPLRNADKVFIFESPEELVGAKVPEVKDEMPEKQATPSETIKPVPVKPVPATCEMFKTMETFDKSMVLHTDSTGYKWTLGKLLNGKTLKEATVKGVKYTKADIVCNLKQLAENILGKVNEKVGQVDKAWFLTSCYRNEIPAGGSATSQHLSGQAADIVIGNNFNYQGTYDWAKDFSTNLPYDQFILEYLDSGGARKNWIHMSYVPEGGRRQILTFLNHKTATKGSLKKLA